MNLIKRIAIFVALLSTVAMAPANPIPWPLPANMPLEDMYARLDESDQGGLRETFVGDYYFSHIPPDECLMKYPVPPDSDGIRVAMGQLPEGWEYDPGTFPFLHEMQVHQDPVEWFYIRELYPTILPQWPGIPMIAWNGPFPEKTLLSVEYEHDLLRRGRGYIYFYALGTGKYSDTYQKEAIAFLDISMPPEYDMHRLFLDETPHAFAVTSEDDGTESGRRIVSICASSQFGPFTKDIIGHIRPTGGSWSPYTYDTEDAIAGVSRQIRLMYKVEQCGSTEPPAIAPNVAPFRRRMIVYDHITFNCCPEYVRMTILVDGDQVIFREKAMEEAPCDCNCTYPMKGIAGPFAPGAYQVQLIDPHGKMLLEREVVIE